MVSLLLINQSFHNHGEDLRLLTQSTDSRIHLGNGSTRNHWSRRNTSTTTSITIRPRTLETMESSRRSTDSLQLINQSSHNHGEEQRKPTQRTDSRTQNGNGSQWLSKRRETSVIMALKSISTDLLPMTNLFF